MTQANSHRYIRIILELVLFAMLGALMFCSRVIMALLPNIHLLGMLTMVCTIVFRAKGLIPVYIYVFLEGLFAGFSTWWLPYLYIWAILWGMTMLLPKKCRKRWRQSYTPLLVPCTGWHLERFTPRRRRFCSD